MMKLLPLAKYNDLIDGAEILSSEYVDGRISPKVLRLKDKSILKLFRLKRALSSALLVPYAVRFQRHVKKLQAFDIPTVDIRAVYKIADISRTAVHYIPLEGPTLREHCESLPLDARMAKKLGKFFHFLHLKGVYFRSIHFGNLVIADQQRIGLIDVADMRFRRAPLNLNLRTRNLRHLFRYNTDLDYLAPVRQCFIDAYCASARLHARNENYLRYHFECYFQKRVEHHGRSACD